MNVIKGKLYRIKSIAPTHHDGFIGLAIRFNHSWREWEFEIIQFANGDTHLAAGKHAIVNDERILGLYKNCPMEVSRERLDNTKGSI